MDFVACHLFVCGHTGPAQKLILALPSVITPDSAWGTIWDIRHHPGLDASKVCALCAVLLLWSMLLAILQKIFLQFRAYAILQWVRCCLVLSRPRFNSQHAILFPKHHQETFLCAEPEETVSDDVVQTVSNILHA